MYKWKNTTPAICVVCSQEYLKKNKRQKACSADCYQIMRHKIYEQKKKDSEYLYNNGTWLKLRFEIFKRDSFTCQYCGRDVKEDKIKLQCDHIIPKNKGGKDITTNLITSCFECNQGKRDVLLKQRLIQEHLKNKKLECL